MQRQWTAGQTVVGDGAREGRGGGAHDHDIGSGIDDGRQVRPQLVRLVPPLGRPTRDSGFCVGKDAHGLGNDLAQHAEAYRGFIDRFSRLAELLADGARLGTAESLVARLVLVHRFRLVVLRDPRLPQAAVPADWPGEAARSLFTDLYLRLSPEADRHVARHFVTVDGGLAEVSEATARRLSLLRGAN